MRAVGSYEDVAPNADAVLVAVAFASLKAIKKRPNNQLFVRASWPPPRMRNISALLCISGGTVLGMSEAVEGSQTRHKPATGWNRTKKRTEENRGLERIAVL
jgi:hypothetical protein